MIVKRDATAFWYWRPDIQHQCLESQHVFTIRVVAWPWRHIIYIWPVTTAGFFWGHFSRRYVLQWCGSVTSKWGLCCTGHLPGLNKNSCMNNMNTKQGSAGEKKQMQMDDPHLSHRKYILIPKTFCSGLQMGWLLKTECQWFSLAVEWAGVHAWGNNVYSAYMHIWFMLQCAAVLMGWQYLERTERKHLIFWCTFVFGQNTFPILHCSFI